VVPTPGLQRGQTASAGIAVWLPDNDGPTAFTGTDSVIVSLKLIEFENGATVETLQWQFNLAPYGVTIQNALRLTLSSSVGGATIVATGGTPDFTLNFGKVNGLGIGPAAGFTTTAGTGGYFYATPYDLNAAFTDFTSTTATIGVYVITDFAHPALLELNDATSTSGPFTAISKNVLAQTRLTNTAADRSRTTRVLGLFVANTNGAASFRGADNATLTYTMTVP
ncbi:MAG TPA: hypothetical protein VJ853_15285, partial [Thermoanaerobaculia bacterium]|nr:hypothetical protein [Thermoanaerobaculia bacterium]